MNLRRLTDSARKRFSHGAAILLYHRITTLERDPQLLAVSRKHFEEHLEVLRRTVNVVPLRNLAPGTVSITFDDGYADNLLEAKPALARYNMPATVFVATGFVGSDREFWWDDLDRILLEADDAGWNVEQPADKETRRHEYAELCRTLRTASTAERKRYLEELQRKKNRGAGGRHTHRTMTAAEVRSLADGGLVEIGAHTVSHPVLSSLSATEQQAEIEASKRDLEDLTGNRIETFAYPYGGKQDYNRESVSCVRNAGFSLSCSNFPGLVWPATNRFELPRLLIRDWDGDEFERRLKRIIE